MPPHTYYFPLLLRYARRLVHNPLVAFYITESVFETLDGTLPASEIRQSLKTQTLEHCRQWLAAKPETLYLRKPKNPT